MTYARIAARNLAQALGLIVLGTLMGLTIYVVGTALGTLSRIVAP
jgi:hypothetical protein